MLSIVAPTTILLSSSIFGVATIGTNIVLFVNIRDVINVRLKELLEKREISLYKLAKDTGVSYNNLHRIATNRAKVISFEMLEKLCMALDCTPNDLLELEGK